MSNEHNETLNDQQIVRREKMAALAEQGIDPFGNDLSAQQHLVN